MFDVELGELGAADLAGLFRACVEDEVRAQNRQLVLATEWADAHPGHGSPMAGVEPVDLVGERAVCPGGVGTPAFAEFAPARLAPEGGISLGQAAGLITDGLDVRHRLPLIWSQVCAGRARAWPARRVARATRELSLEQAAAVDRLLMGKLFQVGRQRLENLITAALYRVDAERMAELAVRARRSRYVRRGQSNEDGVAAVYVRLDAPDAARFEAGVDQMARILRAAWPVEGVPDRHAETLDEWRAVAVGVLAQPVLAARILIQHQQPDLLDALADLDPAANSVANAAVATAADLGVDPVAGAGETVVLIIGWEPADDIDGALYADHNSPGLELTTTLQPTVETIQPTGPTETVVPVEPLQLTESSGLIEPVQLTEVPGPTQSTVESIQPVEPVETYEPIDPDIREVARQRALRRLLRSIDPTRLANPLIFHVHCMAHDLTTGGGVARIEELGPALLHQVRDWFGTGTRIRLQPVIDPSTTPPVDAYEIPDPIRAALHLRNPTSIFPHSNTTSRTMDLDHTTPYQRGPDRPPGQTGLHNLGPLTRREHRARTFGPLRLRQPWPGIFTWRTPTGRVIITTAAGTHDIGINPYADAIWHAAGQATATAPSH